MKNIVAQVGNVKIGNGCGICVQTMCNTHTSDVEATVRQCLELYEKGAEIVRITVPGLGDVENVKSIKQKLRSEGCLLPIVADIHFSSKTAIEVAPYVEKVRINPGNFHKNHEKAAIQFAKLVEECKKYGTAIRIGINHGSLGERITSLYGNTPEAMALAAMEWIDMCMEHDFYNVVLSLKASNTIVMADAYRHAYKMMCEKGVLFPLHVGVTEAGNGDSGRIKSLVGISSVLSEKIGNTVRVSLTESPSEEIPVAKYLADRYDEKIKTSLQYEIKNGERNITAVYEAPSRERLIYDAACDYGKRLLDKEIDSVIFEGCYRTPDGEIHDIGGSDFAQYLADEILQASRRKFYRPEYIACPGCGRTMYKLEETFEEVKKRTSHFSDKIIAVMGCIVNGPGEMADADYGYVGEGNKKVTIYRKKEPVLSHIPEENAVDELVKLMESDIKQS